MEFRSGCAVLLKPLCPISTATVLAEVLAGVLPGQQQRPPAAT